MTTNPQTEARAIAERLRAHRQAFGVHYEQRPVEVCIEGAEAIDRLATALAEKDAELVALQVSWRKLDDTANEWADRAHTAEAQLADARKALEASASALDEAREDVEHWGSYAGEYFQNKHDLDGDLDRIARQASAARRVCEGGKVDG